MPLPLRAAAELGISCRAETDPDRPFIAALYASTRAPEFAALGWPDDMLAAFLGQQHKAQQSHYRTVYPDGEWLVVERSGTAIGRLYLNESAGAVHLVDISLVPGSRGTGIGSALIADLIAHAHGVGKPVRLSVEKGNEGAARLYRRLGFGTVEDHGLHEVMLCRPPAADQRKIAS